MWSSEKFCEENFDRVRSFTNRHKKNKNLLSQRALFVVLAISLFYEQKATQTYRIQFDLVNEQKNLSGFVIHEREIRLKLSLWAGSRESPLKKNYHKKPCFYSGDIAFLFSFCECWKSYDIGLYRYTEVFFYRKDFFFKIALSPNETNRLWCE